MSKIEIKNRWTGSVLFEYEKENNTLKDTVEQAVRERANLEGANLKGADLKGANLEGANLEGADLKGADLEGACIYVDDIEIDIESIIKNFEEKNNIKITETYINKNVIPTRWSAFWKYGLIICDWEIKEKEETTEESKETEEIKEIEYYEISGEGEQHNEYRLTDSDNYICEYYNQFEMVVLRKINEIARRVNETERKVNKLIKESEEK